MRQTNKGLLGLDGSDRTIISGDLHSVLVVCLVASNWCTLS